VESPEVPSPLTRNNFPPSFLQKRAEQKDGEMVLRACNKSMRDVFSQRETSSQQFINPEWEQRMLAEDKPDAFSTSQKIYVSQVVQGLPL